MKLLVLAAFVVAVSSGRLSQQNTNQEQPSQWPWEAGKVYHYDVETHTLAHHTEGASTGQSFKARLTVRVQAPGQLQAKLERPQNAQVHQELRRHEPMPQDLKYQPVQYLDKPFVIKYDNGRVLSLSLPSSVPLAQENLLKGLIGALQVDLTTHRNVHGSYDTYDKETQQGLFRKMETDVTGDCETLYSASPAANEWRRELPQFAQDEDPIEITKSKNYGNCHHRVDYHFGVPEGAEWTGTAHKNGKEQFIKRATVSRILVGKNGPIYKAETTSTVHVHPHLYGKQKAEVHSKVSVQLDSYEKDSEPQWPQPEGNREIQNLLYSLNSKQIDINEDSESSSASNDSSEKHIRIDKYTRDRRSVKSNSVVVNKVIQINNGQQNSGSSSSSESASAYINDDVPKNNEPAYAALYMNPQPHNDKKQNPMNAQKLAQEIAQQLQNPNNMPKADFLSKFSILVRVISSMSYGQLSQTSRSIEIARSSNDNIKSDMWMIYRDAVAQAGTSPAFQQIKTWIENRKIEGEEAAEVVAVLARSLRYPTKETMRQFFELSVNPEVSSQMYLNSTALIAAAKFINMGQVNNDTAHRYYPSHMYGRLSRKHDRFVEEEILPRLSSELNRAVQEGDSHKSQVYVKAIGNLGHRAILNVFAPYLEGKTPASTYLRTRIVENLRVLANQKDHHARAALYSILKNTAEPYAVRVAAIQNIFMGRPTSAMMQAMAQMTKEDPSRHVRAALKSAIQSAAELKQPHFWELARTAQAARDMVTKEDFGLQYSRKNINGFSAREDGEMSVFSNIGSKDSLFPKTFKYAMKNRIAGWDEETAFSTAASSVQRVAEYFLDQIFENNQQQQNSGSNPNHKYSAKKISEMLNIKKNHNNEPLEASFYMDFMDQQRYFAFNEQDIEQFGGQVREYLSNLNQGANKHYTKIVNRKKVSVMFPVASGVPFIYRYKEPTLVHIQSSAKGKVDLKDRYDFNVEMALDKEVSFTYAANQDGSVGFLDTLSNQHASVGLVEKFQLHIPVKMHLEVQSGEMKLRLAPKDPEQDSTIVHYSLWPYSANQKKDTLMTFSQDPSTKVITRPNKVLSLDYKFGQQIGSPFQLQGYSYSKDFRNIGRFLQTSNYLSNIISAPQERDIAQTHFNLRYLAKQAKNKAVTISAAYDTLYNQKNAGQMSPVATEMNDASANSQSRREQFVKRVTTGVNAAKAQVVDLGVKFESPDQLEYSLTFAIGQSDVDPKAQFAFYAGKKSNQNSPTQINVVGTLTKPSSIAAMNFNEALKKDINMNLETDIRYNQEHIHIQGNAERTKKYADQLQKHYLGQECQQETLNGNNYQQGCHRVIVMAHAPDNFKFTVTYKNISPATKYIASQAYKVAEGLSIWQAEINPQRANPEGKIDINVEASYLTHTLNFDLNSHHGEMRLKNVPIPKSTPGALAAYRPIQPHERVLNHYTQHQYQPFCSVDSSKVRTFSERSYNYKLTRSWHVVLHDDRPSYNEDLVVLARRPSENQQEMYISYRSHTGKELEIEVQPAPQGQNNHAVNVKTNAKKVSEGAKTMYWDDVDETPILEYYTDNDRVLMLKINENRLRVMYDGSRVVVITNQKRRNIRGICGYMSGEPRDDYLTPNGLIDEPQYYGASYVLIDENSDPNEQQLHSKAKQMAYEPKHKYTTILRSDEQWQQEMRLSSQEEWGSQNIYRSRNYLRSKGPCELKPQVQYYENHGEICITNTELPACQTHCSGEGYRVQPAQVVCRPKFDQQFRSYRDQIRQGGNPQVSGPPQIAQYRVPESCNA